MEHKEINKSVLINLLYDYMRLYDYPDARIIFKDECADLFVKGYKHWNISYGEVYQILKRLIDKKARRGQGYSGRSMSVNAELAYSKGLRPLSKIRAGDLGKCGFYYPVDFFKWLIKTWHICPKEIHHTSAACNMTCFYDDSVIYHLVRDCNLELLYKIYKGEITKEQAKMERGIKYARVRVYESLLGGKGGTVRNLNCIVCDGIVFYSAKLCFWIEDKRLEILEMYDKRPDTDFENKNLHSLSDKLVKNKTGKYYRYVKQEDKRHFMNCTDDRSGKSDDT